MTTWFPASPVNGERDAMSTSILTILEGQPDRDYSLVGADSRAAVDQGLADAEWFRPYVDPERFGELMERTTARAVADVGLWFALLVAFGLAAVLAIGNWWAIPLFIVYGALYGGASDARWHEFGHGTATRSERFNNAVYYVASFFSLRGPTYWRWSHFRHHSDTIIVGLDPEIQVPRPPTIRRFLLNYTNLVNAPRTLAKFVRHASGRVDAATRSFVPAGEIRKVVWEARASVGILAGVVAVCVLTRSIVPLLLVGLPSIYGAWLMVFFGATQHLGLHEDVLDHRLNTRTVYINPIFRFLYLNMNYHVEHHLFPAVPYYRLPALHAEIRDVLPEPSPSMWSAYREIIGELLRQRTNPTHELEGRLIPDVSTDTADLNGTDDTPGKNGDVADLNAGRGVDGHFDLGPINDIALGTMKRADVGDRTLVVARLSSGDVCVVDGICTHGQTHLAGGVLIDGQIECPKHNGRFDLQTGAPCRRPATVPLEIFDVDIEGGFISTRLEVQNASDIPDKSALLRKSRSNQ
jgi:Na+-transporting NADH:ubiquinone oxidoreductase subunit F